MGAKELSKKFIFCLGIKLDLNSEISLFKATSNLNEAVIFEMT